MRTSCTALEQGIGNSSDFAEITGAMALSILGQQAVLHHHFVVAGHGWQDRTKSSVEEQLCGIPVPKDSNAISRFTSPQQLGFS